MSTLTQASLHDAVASRCPFPPEDLRIVYGDIDEWALDCLRWLLPLAPEGVLEGGLATYYSTSPATIPTSLKIVRVFHADNLDTFTYLSPQEFSKAKVHVPASDYYATNEMSSGTGGRYGRGDRVYTVEFNKVYAYRLDDGDYIRVVYVDEPSWGGNTFVRNDLDEGEGTDYHSYRLRLGHTSSALSEPGEGADWNTYWTEIADNDGYSSWNGDSYPYTSSGLVIPTGWEHLVALYCTIQMAFKAKDEAVIDRLSKQLNSELMRFGGFTQFDPSPAGG